MLFNISLAYTAFTYSDRVNEKKQKTE